jgi:excisionase family DNA binding protein
MEETMKQGYKAGDFIEPKEVAEILCVTKAHVYNLIKRGKLKAVKPGRVVRIYRSSLNEFMKKVEFKPYV